jgi:hypothetical protein
MAAALAVAAISVFRFGETPGHLPMVAALLEKPVSSQILETILPTGPADLVTDYGFFDGLSPERATFRIGAMLCGLQLSIKADDTETAHRLLPPLISLLSAVDTERIVTPALKRLAEHPAAGQPLALDPALIDEVYRIIGTHGYAHYYLFGLWTLGGRYAAAAGNEAYFRFEEMPLFLNTIEQQPLPPGVTACLSEIRRTLKQKPLDPQTFNHLSNQFGTIMEILL